MTYWARFSNNRVSIQLGFYLLEIDVVQSIDVQWRYNGIIVMMRVYFLFYSIMGHAMTITLLYRNRWLILRRFTRDNIKNNTGNVIIIRTRIVIIIIIVIYAKLKNLYSSGDNFITKILFGRARSNRGFVMNQIFVTDDDATRQQLISRRPIDGWYEGSALSLRRLSNEVEEQIVRLNNAP